MARVILRVVWWIMIVNERRHQVSTDLNALDEMNACHDDLVERCGRMAVFICNFSRRWQR